MTEKEKEATKQPYVRPLLSYSEYFGNSKVLGEVLRSADRRPWLTSMPSSPDRHQYVIWLGCSVIRTVHIAETLGDILEHIGVDHVTLGGPSHCCGIVHSQRNDHDVSRNMLKQTLGKFDAFQPEQLLYWCPSCDQHLSNAPQDMLSETTKQRASVSAFLADKIEQKHYVRAVPRKVALHWHGGTVEQEQEAAAVMFVLSRIPGLAIVDMPSILNVGRHCTDTNIQRCGEAVYREVEAEWTKAAREIGADCILSIYHSCHRELLHGQNLLDEAERLPIVNYLSLVAEALGLPAREDKYARYTASGDVDAIVAELEETMQRRGMNSGHVRRAVQANFARRV